MKIFSEIEIMGIIKSSNRVQTIFKKLGYEIKL